jgi:alcohol dehydrogenase YqhD (iron-dependent ADH family)
MENFEFYNPTKLVFGKNTHLGIGREVKKYSKKVLLHYGGGSIKKSNLYNEVIQSLTSEGIEVVELGGVKPNPRLSLVQEGIDICKQHNIDFILAVGGGSVIDSAKAIAAGACYEGNVWDFFEGKCSPAHAIPIGIILTIPAAGSESSNGTVVTNEEGWYKRSFMSPLIIPVFAILNPELTYTLPHYQTVCGVADMMSHIMERYFVHATDNDVTDRLCEATLRSIINNARIVLEQPDNYAARAELMWAGTIAHNNSLGVGRTGDWGSHNIEHELSGIYDVAHGAGLAVVFPAWMKYVYGLNVNRFVQFAVRVWDVDLSYGDLDKVALEGIRRLTAFFKEIGLPVTLEELGVPVDRLEEMAAKATETGPTGRFKKLYKEDVLEILNLAR